MLICSGANALLDLVFVIGFHWGIAGAAAATVLSQFFSAALVLRVLTVSAGEYGFTWHEFRIDGQMAKQILSLGLPVGLQMAIVAFSNVFVQAYINVFSTACIAGWGAFTKLDQYMLLPIQSMGQAVTTFVGQNIGAKKLDRAQKGTGIAFLMTIRISTVTAITLWSFAPWLIGLFSPDQETIRYGTLFIRLCSPIAIFCCFNLEFICSMLRLHKNFW